MGAAIAARRKEAGTLPADLAAQAGLPVEHLQAIEAGELDATWGELRHLASAFGTDLPQLIQEAEMQEP